MRRRLRSLRPDRVVWASAALCGVLLVALLAFELARPRDFYTGTNGAGASGPVVHVEAGQELCVPALEIPAGTARLRLRLAPVGPTNATARVVAGGRATQAAVAIAAAAGPPGSSPGILDVGLPERPQRPDATQGKLCVTPAGPIDVAGRPGLETGQVAPTVAGAPADARVAVWFLPPAGAQRSLLAQLPDMAERAALFRPGVVGPWTYWIVLLALAPLLALGAVWLLARAAAERLVRRTAVLIGVIGFCAALAWALVTPPLNAPDELEHVAFAQSIAERGRAPVDHASSLRPYSSEAQVAYEGARTAGQYRQRDGRPPWLRADELRWERRARAERPRPDDGGGWVTVSDYTPLYYVAVAPAYLAASDASIWSRITAMRLTSALMGGLAAALVFLLVAELLPRPVWPAVAAGVFVALQPMFSFISGMVNNDAAVNALAVLALLLVVRGLRRGLSTAQAVALGAAIALLPMAKGNGFFLLPAIAVGLGGIAWRARNAGTLRAGQFVAIGGAFVATAALSVALAAAFHGNADPTQPGWYAATGNAYPTLPGARVRPSGALDDPVRFGEYLWQTFLPKAPGMEDLRPGPARIPAYYAYVERAWGAFGFAVITFPRWVYAIVVAAVAALVALGVLALRRERAAVRRRSWELAVLLLVVVGVVLGTEVAYFAPGDPTIGEFGRYLFPAAGAFAAVAAGALFGAGRRGALVVGSALVASLAGLFWASLWLAMAGFYT